ncbi:hypothetical protein Hanom_Chr04g00365581 [Helianthus anomalus]
MYCLKLYILMYIYIYDKSEFQGLSFIFIPIFRRFPLCSKFKNFVLYVLKSIMFCPLDITQFLSSVKCDHVQIT